MSAIRSDNLRSYLNTLDTPPPQAVEQCYQSQMVITPAAASAAAAAPHFQWPAVRVHWQTTSKRQQPQDEGHPVSLTDLQTSSQSHVLNLSTNSNNQSIFVLI